MAASRDEATSAGAFRNSSTFSLPLTMTAQRFIIGILNAFPLYCPHKLANMKNHFKWVNLFIAFLDHSSSILDESNGTQVIGKKAGGADGGDVAKLRT